MPRLDPVGFLHELGNVTSALSPDRVGRPRDGVHRDDGGFYLVQLPGHSEPCFEKHREPVAGSEESSPVRIVEPLPHVLVDPVTEPRKIEGRRRLGFWFTHGLRLGGEAAHTARHHGESGRRRTSGLHHETNIGADAHPIVVLEATAGTRPGIFLTRAGRSVAFRLHYHRLLDRFHRVDVEDVASAPLLPLLVRPQDPKVDREAPLGMRPCCDGVANERHAVVENQRQDTRRQRTRLR